MGKKKKKTFGNLDLDALDLDHMPSMESLLGNSTASCSTPSHMPQPDVPPTPRPPRPPAKRAASKRIKISGRVVVLDGSNIARLAADERHHSSLRFVLALALKLAQAHAKPICVFDANERFLLQSNPHEPQAAEYLLRLARHLPEFVRLAPPATDADTMILRIADELDAIIVGNDRFISPKDAHHHRHAWLLARHQRIAAVELLGSSIQCPALGVKATATQPLERLVDDCFDRMST